MTVDVPGRGRTGLSQLAGPEPYDNLVTRGYDRLVDEPAFGDCYESDGYVNFGYWRRSTGSQREASDQLVDKLLEMVPDKRGNILDVACGKGGTTNRLLRRYAPGEVVGINLSARQLDECRERVPQCRFGLMDATDLQFADGTWDNIICVEAAFHFDLRADFISEAHRVLRPGGRLVLSDMVLSARSPAQPQGNWVPDLAAYKQRLLAAGFDDVVVIDATIECWVRFAHHFLAQVREGGRKGTSDPLTLRRAYAWLWRTRPAFYLLAMCEK